MHTTGLNLQLSSSRQSDQWNGAGGARLGVTGTALPSNDGHGTSLESCVPVQPEAVEAGGCRTVPTTDFRSCIGLWRVRHVGLEAWFVVPTHGVPPRLAPATVCTWPHRSTRTGNGWVHETVGFCTAAAVGRPGQRQSLGSLPVRPILPSAPR